MKPYWILCVAVLAALTGCSPVFEWKEDPAVVLELETNMIKFDTPDASSAVVGVETKGESWSVSTDPEATWIAVEPADGSVSISVAANPDIIARETVITVACGNNSSDIKVTQAATGIVFTSDKEEIRLDSKGGTVPVNLSSNLPFTIVPSADWIVPSANEGTPGTSISVSVPENASLLDREGNLDFYIGGERIGRIVVTQERVVPEMVFSTSTLNVGSDASEVNLTIDANWPWTMETSAKDSLWISLGALERNAEGLVAAGTKTLSVSVPSTLTTRQGTINFSCGGTSYTVEVSQEGAAISLDVDKSVISLSTPEAQSADLGIVCNGIWEISGLPAWISVSQSTGEGSKTISVSVEKRAGGVRSGSFTVTCGELSKTVTVNQPAGAYKIELIFTDLINGNTVAKNPFTFLPGSKKWGSGYAAGYNLGIISVALTADPDFKMELFNNVGYFAKNASNGLRIVNAFGSNADDQSQSEMIRDEMFTYIKFPGLDGLKLKRITLYTTTTSDKHEAYVTADPFVSNEDARSKALSPVVSLKQNLDNEIAVSGAKELTPYYLMFDNDTTIELKIYNIIAYYE